MTVQSTALRPFAWLGRRWISHGWIDLAIVAMVPTIHLSVHLIWGIPSLLHSVPAAKRPSLYGATATVVSLTGTLASVTVAQYLSNRGERMRELKRLYPKNLASTWRGVFLGSVCATSLFLTAYALDSRTKANELGIWFFEFGIILALLRFIRLALLFGDLVQLIVLDDTDPIATTGVKFRSQFVTSGNGKN